MGDKTIKTRIQLKYDTEENWNKSVLEADGGTKTTTGSSFIPKKGEVILYSTDGTHPFSRLKVGDGITNVVQLPFLGIRFQDIGDKDNIKTKQIAVTDPNVTGGATSNSFIDTISQDTNGEITVTKANLAVASTSSAGIVQLSSAINSTDTDKAATPSAVKDAYDLANGAIPKNIGLNTGDLIYYDSSKDAKYSKLGIGANNSILKVVSGALSWSALTKGDLGLDNVENTALSTWTGSSNITTVGTISSGTWNGDAIAANKIGELSTAKLTSGILGVSRGGTGLDSIVADQVLIGGANNSITQRAITSPTSNETFTQYLAQNPAPDNNLIVNLKTLKLAIPPINLSNPISTTGSGYQLSYYAPTSKGTLHSVLIAQGTSTNSQGTEPLWLDPTSLSGVDNTGSGGTLFYGRDSLSNESVKPFKTQWGTLPVEQGGTGCTTFSTGQLLVGNGTGNLTTIVKTYENVANTVVVRDSSGDFCTRQITLHSGGYGLISDYNNENLPSAVINERKKIIIIDNNGIPTHYGNLEANNLTATIGIINMNCTNAFSDNETPMINWYKKITVQGDSTEYKIGEINWDITNNTGILKNYYYNNDNVYYEAYKLPNLPIDLSTNKTYTLLSTNDSQLLTQFLENSVLYTAGGFNKVTSIRSNNGALYASSQGGNLQWGTLPVAQGGTGVTDIANIQAGKDANGDTIASTYVKVDGTNIMTGALSITPNIGEGGQINLNASVASTTQAGITLDQYNSTLRIFGIASEDEISKIGSGTPLVIDPYNKTITGIYSFDGNSATASLLQAVNNNTSISYYEFLPPEDNYLVWGQSFSDTRLQYTPNSEGALPTTVTDTGNIALWLTAADATSDNAELNISIDGTYYGKFTGNVTGNATTATAIQTPGTTAQFYRGDNTWSNTLTGNLTVPNLYINGGDGAGIYYNGTQATYRMIRFLDNTGDIYGNGISIGGGGYTIIGSGESADTMVNNLGYTGGSEITVVASDGDIAFYPGNNSYDASTKLTMTASRFWAGVNGNTTREAQIGVQSGAGQIYLWSAASTTGDRGIWTPAHGTGGAKYVISVNTNNVAFFQGGLTGPGVSGSTHAEALKAYFNSYKATEPRNALVAHYSSAHSNGSLCMGYFLNGYDSGPYGGFFVCHYNWPRYVGINNGTYTQHDLISNQNYTSYTVTKTGSGASGTWGINISGRLTDSAHSWSATEVYNYMVARVLKTGDTMSGTLAIVNNTQNNTTYNALLYVGHSSNNDWGAIITKGSSCDYGLQVICKSDGSYGVSVTGRITGTKVYGAVWNDYAECRNVNENIMPGQVVYETSSKTMELTNKRLQAGCRVVSDTYGMCIGETEDAKIPVAVCGRVLVYPYRNREQYELGAAVCSAPNGTVDIMTREEIRDYPERIIGTISEIPDYEIWHAGERDGNHDIQVKGRIWIYVR